MTTADDCFETDSHLFEVGGNAAKAHFQRLLTRLPTHAHNREHIQINIDCMMHDTVYEAMYN